MPVQELTRFLTELEQYRFLNAEQLRQAHALGETVGQDARQLAAELIRRGWLTPFQVNQILQGHAEKLVLGPYVLLERLGQGGMGQVYKARHVLMDRLVALKVLRAELLLDHPSAVDRFRREIQAAGKLTHPNVVLAHDANEVGETFFLVMEYVAGDDLGRLLKQRGRLPPGEAAGYVRQAALGLQHAHEHGLVHRDIKPSNLIRASEGGVVKILDLGLARLHGGVEALVGALTHEGAIMGTPDYIAPEQATDSRTADIRADIYSLGCTLYHLLAGQPPFPGGSVPQKLLKHQQATPTPVEQLCPEAPPGLIVVVRRMMAKQPQDRYQTPREIADALIPFISADSSIPVATVYEAPSAPDTPTVDYSLLLTDNSAPSAATKRSWPQRKRDRFLIAGALTAGLLAIVLPFLPKFGGRAARPVEKEQPDVLLSDGKDKRPDPPAKGGNGEPNGARVAEPKQLPPLPADAPVKLAHVLQGHTGKVRCFAFSPDSKLLASGGDDNQALLWDVRSGEQHGPPLRHKYPVRALAWTFDGKTLASGSWGKGYDAAIKLWESAVGRDFQTRPWEDKTGTPSKADVRSMAFSPDGRFLASGGGPLRIWDLSKAGERSVCEWQETFPSYLYGVAFSPDSRAVAAGCHETGDSVRVWRIDDAGDPTTLRGNEQAFGLAHSDVFGVVAFAAEGKLLVRVTSNGRGAGKSTASVKVWKVEARQQRYSLHDTYEIPGGSVFALASAADGQLRVAVAEGPSAFPGGRGFGKEPSRTEVTLWDGATRKVRSFETGHKDSITSLAFSPDGSRLVTGSDDQTAKLWELTR